MPRVIVVGGSFGGLTAALVLRDIGCDVTVFERSAATLQARGAGIAALDAAVRYFVERTPLDLHAICSTTEWIRSMRPDGSVEYELRHPYRFSAWNTVYRALLSQLAPERYRLGHPVVSVRQCDGGAAVRLADGEEVGADLVVCADGVGSTARHMLFPEVSPHYAGYVAWRGTSPESELSTRTHHLLGNALTYQVMADSHLLAYPIPDQAGQVAPGQRLMNFVWYRNVPDDGALAALLTDRDGRRQSRSLPPGAVRHEAVVELRDSAARLLARPLAEAVSRVAEPFLQVVLDLASPRMAVGRICLVGDAAFTVRPHAAAGTAKAAADGWTLAEEIVAADGDLSVALPAWERRQLELGRSLLRRTQELGDNSQFRGTFRPGDPRMLFGLYGPER